MGVAYYRFETLPKTVRESNKITSKSRLDCTYHYSNGYKGIDPFKSPVRYNLNNSYKEKP